MGSSPLVPGQAFCTCWLSSLRFDIRCWTPIPFDCEITHHPTSSALLWALVLSPFGDPGPDVTTWSEGSHAEPGPPSPAPTLLRRLCQKSVLSPTEKGPTRTVHKPGSAPHADLSWPRAHNPPRRCCSRSHSTLMSPLSSVSPRFRTGIGRCHTVIRLL